MKIIFPSFSKTDSSTLVNLCANILEFNTYLYVCTNHTKASIIMHCEFSFNNSLSSMFPAHSTLSQLSSTFHGLFVSPQGIIELTVTLIGESICGYISLHVTRSYLYQSCMRLLFLKGIYTIYNSTLVTDLHFFAPIILQ